MKKIGMRLNLGVTMPFNLKLFGCVIVVVFFFGCQGELEKDPIRGYGGCHEGLYREIWLIGDSIFMGLEGAVPNWSNIEIKGDTITRIDGNGQVYLEFIFREFEDKCVAKNIDSDDTDLNTESVELTRIDTTLQSGTRIIDIWNSASERMYPCSMKN